MTDPTSSLANGIGIVLIIYAALVIYFVIKGAKKTKSVKDFAIGSINFPAWTVGLALAASMTSAATFIINPGFVAYSGISGVLSLAIMLPLGAMVSLVVVTKSFKKIGNQIQALTIAQWIGERYNNKAYTYFFATISLLLLTFVVLIAVGISKLLSVSLGINEVWVLVATVCFIFGYMMFGGANSMVYTNTIQAIIMVVVAIILLGSGYHYFNDGVSGFITQLKAIDPNLVKPFNTDSFLFRDVFEVIFCQIVVGVAIVFQPHIITKSLLLKSDKDVNIYLIVGVVVEILFFLVIFAGLYARLTFPDLTLNGSPIGLDSIMSTYVVQAFGSVIGVIVVMGLLSAGISTMEGLIQTLSTTLTSDIILPLRAHFLPNTKKKKVNDVFINRMVIVGLAIITILISYKQMVSPDLSVGIFAQNGVYAYFSAAFIPVLFGSVFKKIPVYIPFTASIVAIITHVSIYYGRISPYMQLEIRNPAIPAAMAILFSTIIAFTLLLIHKVKTKNLQA